LLELQQQKYIISDKQGRSHPSL